MSYITSIGTAVPPYQFDQSTICNFMSATMAKADTLSARKIRAVFRASGIQRRYSVLEDYGRVSDFTFYPNSEGEVNPGTGKRMEIFKRQAVPLSVASVQDMLRSNPGSGLAGITHLIVVSCTGMYAPGLDIDLVKELNLPRQVQRICIQFMGCYAAFNALKVADAICRSEKKQKVLIVCTELCSIHFQQTPSDDNILANALFADGSAAMMVESENIADKSFEIASFHNDLALKGENDMAWNVADEGFQMRLSSYVPALIRDEIAHLIDELLRKIGMSTTDIRFFALHPGGVKILQTIEQQLGLLAGQCEESYSVLRNFGNMSSATVVFVLREIMQRITPQNANQPLLSVGFGPGLSLEAMMLKIKTK